MTPRNVRPGEWSPGWSVDSTHMAHEEDGYATEPSGFFPKAEVTPTVIHTFCRLCHGIKPQGVRWGPTPSSMGTNRD